MFGFYKKENNKYKVGIVSDSHGYVSQQILGVLKDCDYILHAGDVTSEKVLDQFRQFRGRFFVVRGNCDRGMWARKISTRQLFTIGDLRFLMVHNKLDAGRLIGQADVVVYGHTHCYAEEIRSDKLWINPGSCGNPRYGNPASMMIMEIEGKNYTIKKIILEDV